MNKKIKISLSIIIAIIVLFLIAGLFYVNDYYHAESINTYLEGNENVSVIKTNNGLLLDSKGNQDVIIFYPGAKVEYTAYLPLFMNLSNNGIDCFIVEMPFNLAFFASDSANDILNNNSYNYTNWYISGHSLSGVMASSYVHENPDKMNGLILLASYPSEDVNNIPVLSIYGSNDKVLDKIKYDESKKYMSQNLSEYIIQGGNHAQFAYYSNQSGDGLSSISREEQIKESVDEILYFINH